MPCLITSTSTLPYYLLHRLANTEIWELGDKPLFPLEGSYVITHGRGGMGRAKNSVSFFEFLRGNYDLLTGRRGECYFCCERKFVVSAFCLSSCLSRLLAFWKRGGLVVESCKRGCWSISLLIVQLIYWGLFSELLTISNNLLMVGMLFLFSRALSWSFSSHDSKFVI